MIIEFFGISGVGKTTVAIKKKEEMLQNNQKVEWPWYDIYVKQKWLTRNIKKTFQTFTYIITHLKWYIKLRRILNTFENIGIFQKFKLVVNGAFLKLNVEKCKKNTIYLFDEGIFQYIWSIYLRNNTEINKETVKMILEHFYIPNEVIIIDANNNTIKDRLIKRNIRTEILNSKKIMARIIINKKRLYDIINIINNDYSEIRIQRIWNDKEERKSESS